MKGSRLKHVAGIFVALALVSLAPVAPAYAESTEVTIRAVESDSGNQGASEGETYAKTGGIGLAPIIAAMGASSVACLTLAHRLGKDEPDGGGDMMP